MLQDVLSSVVKGIDSDRADVVKAAIATVRGCEARDEGLDLKVSSLLNAPCTTEGTILHHAIKREAVDCIRTILVEPGLDLSVKNGAGRSAVQLVSAGSKVMEILNQELLQAVARSDANRVTELVLGGVSVNFWDTAESRNTALHWAATYGTEEIARCLLKHGATVDAKNSEGCTPLHDAAHRGHAPIIRLLLEAKASSSAVATAGKFKGKTPLNLAAAKGIESVFFSFPSAMNGHAAANDHKDSTSADGSAPLPTLKMDFPPLLPLLDADLFDQSSKVAPSPGSLPPLANGSGVKGITDQLPVPSAGDAGQASTPGDTCTPANVSTPGVLALSLDPVTQQKLSLLWPIPQQMVSLEGPPFDPGDKIVVAAVSGPNPSLVHDILNVWRALRSSFEELNLVPILEPLPFSTSPSMAGFSINAVVCQVNPRLFKQGESYRITVKAEQVRILASDLPGMHYGVSIFIQLLELFDETGRIPPLQINDWPDLKNRGVLLDMSLGRVPQEDTLWDLIDRLSILKINEFHLYHRFVVNQGEDAFVTWQFPYSRTVLMDLDRFCSQRHVSLVPVLDVGPKVTFDQVVMLFGAFTDFLSCFTNTEYINVGPRLSSFLLEVGGDGSMRAMHFLPSSTQTLQICGSIFNPACFKNSFSYLPNNMMLMEYGYQADFQFPNAKLYCANGVPFTICPGTSAWNSLAGCPSVAVQNIANAAQACYNNNGVGMLVCNWSGRGHVTHSSFSILPMVAAAGFCWNKSTTVAQTMEAVPAVTSYYMIVDQNQTIGRVLLELGNVETMLLSRCTRKAEGDLSGLMGESGSVTFQLLTQPDSVDLTHLTSADFQRAIRCIRHAQEDMLHTDLDCLQAQSIVLEVGVTCDLMMAACRIGQALLAYGKNPTDTGDSVVNVGVANLHPTTKTDLSNRLLGSVEPYKKAWLGRCKGQGLSESLLVLFSAVKQILPEVQVQLESMGELKLA